MLNQEGRSKQPGAHSPTGARLGRSLFSIGTPLHLSVRVYLVRWRSAGGKQVLKHGGSEVPSRIPLTTRDTTHTSFRGTDHCAYTLGVEAPCPAEWWPPRGTCVLQGATVGTPIGGVSSSDACDASADRADGGLCITRKAEFNKTNH